MVSRRDFLRTGVAGVAAVAACGLPALGASSKPVGVQLYTVRDQIQKDLGGVLAQIAKIGYQQVETFASLYNRPAAELRRAIQDHGLTILSGHFSYEELDSRLDYAHQLGVKYVTCSMLPREMWTLDGFRKAADHFNRVAEQAGKAGMRVAFHNHNYEFRSQDGKTGWQVLLERTDPTLVYFELDCYWAAQAGLNPGKMVADLGKRIRMLHLKDLKPGFPTSQDLDAASSHFTEVGAGILDWKRIFAESAKAGVEYDFVERDSGDLPVIDSLRISFDNIRKLRG